MNIFPFTLLAFGFLSGMKHAFEADHIAAVSSITSNQNSIRKSSLLGLFWGFGHAIALSIVGLIILLLKIEIPEKIALLLELIVGIMLVILGFNVLTTINKNKMHIHKHKHGNEEHIHFHLHKLTKAHLHMHIPFKQSLLIGLIHGLAGSAAITLLVLTAINSVLLGLFYILIFGIGSTLGMVLISGIISLPLILIPYKFDKMQKILHISTGAISTLIGFNIMLNILK